MFDQYKSELDRTILKIWSHCSAYEIECSVTKQYISKFLCPRCGKVLLPGELALSSTSILSPTDATFYICNECALPDKKSKSLEDFLAWAIANEEFNNNN